MADTIGVREVLEFEDEVTGNSYSFTISSNKIARQRKFMDRWSEMYKLDQDDPEFMDKLYDVYMGCAAVALEPHFKKEDSELKTFKANGTPTDEYLELLENCLDFPQAKRVVEVCGGLQLDLDPKMLEALEQSQV